MILRHISNILKIKILNIKNVINVYIYIYIYIIQKS